MTREPGLAAMPRAEQAATTRAGETKASLFWRIVATNAVVFVVGIVALGLTTPTFTLPVVLTEALVLVGGLAVILVANAFLLRLSFRPLEHLTGVMPRIDLLRPGQRLPVSGPWEVADVIRAFNDMLDRLEVERQTSSGRALNAQEAERLRIAQELHDEIGQSLTAVLLQLKRAAAGAPPELRAELLDAQETTRASLDEVRRIAQHLRPGVLEDLGLVTALSALGAGFSEQTGLTVERRFDNGLPGLTSEAELAVYRIAQEGLTNVARHAQASRVELSLERSGSGVRLRISDDGYGLDGGVDGGGLRGMRERAILVGGELAIESSPGAGVEIVLDVPAAERGA